MVRCLARCTRRPLISAPRLRHQGLEFKDSLGYLVKACLIKINSFKSQTKPVQRIQGWARLASLRYCLELEARRKCLGVSGALCAKN